MTQLRSLIYRNCKLFFKDKGLFFTSLITPLILLVLYATFLANVYRDSFLSALGEFSAIDPSIIDAVVAGQLFSSLMAVSCVTVSFCSNMLMVQDKITGAKNDLNMTPVKPSTLSLSYYVATLISTLLVCLVASLACFVYVAKAGWYMSAGDVAMIFLDIFLLVMFGTALSSIINLFLSTQGQISAVGSIISSVYGFICGAYMPISQFGSGLQTVLSFLPGTYATSLMRSHCLGGVLAEMERIGFPEAALTGIRDAIDCNIYFFGDLVSDGVKLLVLSVTVAVLMGVYILLTILRKDK